MINTEATINLARAARRAGAKRFVFLSSIRAKCGPTGDAVLKRLSNRARPMPMEDRNLQPSAAWPNSTSMGIVASGAGLRAWRKGKWRTDGLARSPLPLPLGGLRARRSLLAVENLLAAIETVLATPETLRQPVNVADPQALTVAEMIAAMRHGLGRRPNVFQLRRRSSSSVSRGRARGNFTTGFRLAHRHALRLMRMGWTPPLATEVGLARMMQAASRRVKLLLTIRNAALWRKVSTGYAYSLANAIALRCRP